MKMCKDCKHYDKDRHNKLITCVYASCVHNPSIKDYFKVKAKKNEQV